MRARLIIDPVPDVGPPGCGTDKVGVTCVESREVAPGDSPQPARWRCSAAAVWCSCSAPLREPCRTVASIATRTAPRCHASTNDTADAIRGRCRRQLRQRRRPQQRPARTTIGIMGGVGTTGTTVAFRRRAPIPRPRRRRPLTRPTGPPRPLTRRPGPPRPLR